MGRLKCPICSKDLVEDTRLLFGTQIHQIFRCPDERIGFYHFFTWDSHDDCVVEEYLLKNFRAVVYDDNTRTAIYSHLNGGKEELLRVFTHALTCDEVCRLDNAWSLA
jgi:hypothetical protein